MEDVLDIYELPYNAKRPVVCMDEKPYQLLGEAREPLPMIPGSDRKTDSEYIRNGTVSIFAFVEPLGGTHHVSVHEHRRAADWAEEIKYLADVMYPDAEKIILVMDNLNTHKPASLYKRYPPQEARRIIKKLEIHYTPKHGSWLDRHRRNRTECNDQTVPFPPHCRNRAITQGTVRVGSGEEYFSGKSQLAVSDK